MENLIRFYRNKPLWFCLAYGLLAFIAGALIF